MKISALTAENFKCFHQLELPCAPLTLLTGYNAAGKSTVLQALLLMTQGLRVSPNGTLLPLNGDWVELGSGADLLNYDGAKLYFRLGLTSGSEKLVWHFDFDRELSPRGLMRFKQLVYSTDARSKTFRSKILPTPMMRVPLIDSIREVIFLGAERTGQERIYPVPSMPFRRAGDVGSRGEFAPYWYLECADEEVDVARRHPTDARETVRAQVEAWVNELFPGARANTDRLTSDAPVHLTFSLSKTSAWSKPANVGFGLSYAFPMLVALLTAPKDSIIVVDSAEAHLHPRAQSAVGRLLAQMAAAGLQIVLESHSDHLLNGVRLAVREGLLAPTDTTIHFFGSGDRVGQITTVEIDQNGAIGDWPAGFFDQTEQDLAALSGWA